MHRVWSTVNSAKLLTDLEVADVEVVSEDGDVRGLVHEAGAVEVLDQVSGIRVDDEDGSADGVDDDDAAVGGRCEAGGDVDEPDADAANEVTAVIEHLEEPQSQIMTWTSEAISL